MSKFARFAHPVLALSLTVTIILTGSASGATAAPSSQDTAGFIARHFDGGKFIDGLTPGQPDYGFSIEALLQLKALGQPKMAYAAAEKYLLLSSSVSGSADTPSGFLFNAGKLRLGLAGKWSFVSAVLGSPNRALRQAIIGGILSKIDGTGDVAPDAAANTYDRAWMVLGLVANERPRQAATLAQNISRHQLADGGFNDGFTLGSSSTDGTGITLQALSAALPRASADQRKTILAAIGRSVAYLGANLKQDHFESYGDADVNGTAYAAMGLKAAGKPSLGIVQWLKSEIASDGGLTTPWSAGAGDIYATAQGIVATKGLSYLDLLKLVNKG